MQSASGLRREQREEFVGDAVRPGGLALAKTPDRFLEDIGARDVSEQGRREVR